jgi:hypothetical protein
VHPIKDAISFSYDYPLPLAQRQPSIVTPNRAIAVQGPTVLRFGFVEGDATVQAERAVFDPQSHDPREEFGANGSRANHLAVVLNENEAGASDSAVDAAALMKRHGAEIIVVTRGHSKS